jgi:Heparinase II/III-like protein/Heparinase II/III N-terminus
MSASTGSRVAWYARRFAKMSPTEMCWRVRDSALHAAWSGRQVSREESVTGLSARPRVPQFAGALPAGTAAQIPDEVKKAVLTAATELLSGQWEVFGIVRSDMVLPDWFYDPVTRRRAPADRYAFRINPRSEIQIGNVKHIWEISRLQHLTLLGTAWFLSHDDAYARRIADQLNSWWRENPFLSGVNWTSGIEIGIRLISMAWIRRLLNDWPEVAALFDHNELAIRQIRWHQQYLAAFRSRGSSANNHAIAEAAGQFIASCTFPWFRQSRDWRRQSAQILERELIRNTFPSGIVRELASDYHCFVAELALLAAVEADRAGRALSREALRRLCAMLDSGAALLDERQRPPRQGDGDEGRAVLLDPPAANRWPSLLAMGDAVFGRLDWWPATAPDAASSLVAALGTKRRVAGRPARKPWRFADAGVTLLRTRGGEDPEIWCRCDGGPHGYLSIAAHAHADALSVEVRCAGIDILADPGTYCYNGEPDWRSYFRSTIAHNTAELHGQSQCRQGGSFLWLSHANSRELDVQDIGDAAEWTAEHDGYMSLRPGAKHRRCVRLDRASRTIDIVDEIVGGSQDFRLAFHLGPDVHAHLDGESAFLWWYSASVRYCALLELPSSLAWTIHRGSTDPILGWYSAGLGRRTPSFTLIGQGRSAWNEPFSTRLKFLVGSESTGRSVTTQTSLAPHPAPRPMHLMSNGATPRLPGKTE